MFELTEAPPRIIDVSGLNSDWKIIKFINWIGVLLSAATPYEFSVQEIISLRPFQYYSATLIVLTVFGSIHAICGRSFEVYLYMNLTTITMDILEVIVITIFNLIVLISTAFCTKDIETLFGFLIKNDMFLQTRQKREDKFHEERDFRIKSSLLYFLFLVVVVYDTYVWIAVFGNNSIRYYFFKNFQILLQVFVVLQFSEMLKFIKNRFNFSTRLLMDLVNGMHKFPEEDEFSEKGEKEKWARVSQKIKPRQEDIMQLKLLSKIFDALFDSVVLFNKIFEVKVLFLVATLVASTLKMINFFIALGSAVLLNSRVTNAFFITLQIAWPLLFSVLILVVVKECLNFNDAVRRIAMVIHNRLLEMPSEELLRDEAQEELISLNQQFMYRPLGVGGVFFFVNIEFVYNVVFGMVSFTPVFVQFNRI